LKKTQHDSVEIYVLFLGLISNPTITNQQLFKNQLTFFMLNQPPDGDLTISKKPTK